MNRLHIYVGLALITNYSNVEGTLEVTTITKGIEVMTAADNIKVGATSPVKLDASLSRDKDNNHGDLKYRWSCLTENGQACVTMRSGIPVRLESRIGESKLTDSELTVDPEVLQPGKYIFTVKVSKNEAVGRKNVNVEIAAGDLPVLVTEKSGIVVNAQERIIIKGWVTGEENLQVWWEGVEEPGFSYADISELVAGKKTTLTGASLLREYDLVLPSPGSVNMWNGLEGGTIYKFRLKSRNKDGEESFVEIDCRTNEKPAEGTFTVTPSEGDALVTNFTFNASDWSDDLNDLPLTTSFGYRMKDNDPGAESTIVWAASSSSEVPTATFILTASPQLMAPSTWHRGVRKISGVCADSTIGLRAETSGGTPSSKIIPVIKVCDIYQACAIKDGEPVTVTLTSTLPPEIVGFEASYYEGQAVNREYALFILFWYVQDTKLGKRTGPT
ncbi:hypothetical protein SK128_006504 [Halocaridina rubra]|uniref:PKD/REJ-like domain-containing protein n=1 Tax=Halocaridina rubra TaxID=373956 RepID=A0AAN8ZYF6_HALRR